MPDVEEIGAFLTAIYQPGSEESTSLVKRLLVAARHPMMTLAALHYVAHTPVVDVDIPSSERSRAWWMYDQRRPWRFRGYISSYIELPELLEHYWRGTSKQNLRTRSSQAKLAGFTVRAIKPTELDEVVFQVFEDKGWRMPEIERAQRPINESLEGAVSVGVFDENGRAVSFCFGTQAGNVVRNLWGNTSRRGTVRWLCFSGFVAEAHAQGVRYIVESPPWTFSEGNKIFAGHLGFSVARIRSG